MIIFSILFVKTPKHFFKLSWIQNLVLYSRINSGVDKYIIDTHPSSVSRISFCCFSSIGHSPPTHYGPFLELISRVPWQPTFAAHFQWLGILALSYYFFLCGVHVCLSSSQPRNTSPRDNGNTGLSFLPSLIPADWFPRGALSWPHSSDKEHKSVKCLCLFQAFISESHLSSHPLHLLDAVCWTLWGSCWLLWCSAFSHTRTFYKLNVLISLDLPVPFVLTTFAI